MQSPIVILGYLFMTIKCLRQLPNKLEAVKNQCKSSNNFRNWCRILSFGHYFLISRRFFRNRISPFLHFWGAKSNKKAPLTQIRSTFENYLR